MLGRKARPSQERTQVKKPICPDCGGYIPNNETPGAYMGALSRRDNATEICSPCGKREAMEDYYGYSKGEKIRHVFSMEQPGYGQD